MHSRLEQIVIWPKDVTLPARIVDLRPKEGSPQKRGSVQLIRGTNETGKSALLSIIDYCLGAQSPTIPQDAVFETVHAYGVVLRVAGTRALFVRGAPPDRGTPEGFHFAMGDRAEPSRDAPVLDATPAAYSRALDELLGLDLFQDEPPSEDRAARPLAYDLTPFLLAPSDYLARASGLFQTGHVPPDRVRKMVPLALQAATAEYVRISSRLRSERTKARKLRERVTVLGDALAPIERAIGREYDAAIAHGLLPGTPYRQQMDEQLAVLADFASRMASVDAAVDGAGVWRDLLTRVQDLQKRERAAARSRASIRAQVREVEQVLAAAAAVDEGHAGAEGRIRAFDWFASHVDEAAACPTCGSTSSNAVAELERVANAVVSFQRETEGVQALAADYHKLRTSLDEQLVEAEQAFRKVVEERVAVETLLGGQTRISQPVTVSDISRILGALQPLLGAQEQLQQLHNLRQRIELIDIQVRELEDSLAQHNFDALFAELEGDLFLHVQYYAFLMGLYSSTEPVSLTLANLQLLVEVDSKRGRQKRKIEQLGSGKNWMGYKLSAALGMHELFYRFEHSPVPSFLVVDQLAQVDSSSKADPDRESLTLKAYHCLVHAAQMCDMQILALEGVGDLSYKKVPEIQVIEEWLDGSNLGLIPIEWLP